MKNWTIAIFKRLEIKVIALEIFGLLCVLSIFVMMIGHCVFKWF